MGVGFTIWGWGLLYGGGDRQVDHSCSQTFLIRSGLGPYYTCRITCSMHVVALIFFTDWKS